MKKGREGKMHMHGDKIHNENIMNDKQGSSIKPVLQQVHSWVLIWEQCSNSATLHRYWTDRGISGWKAGLEQQSAPKAEKS